MRPEPFVEIGRAPDCHHNCYQQQNNCDGSEYGEGSSSRFILFLPLDGRGVDADQLENEVGECAKVDNLCRTLATASKRRGEQTYNCDGHADDVLPLGAPCCNQQEKNGDWERSDCEVKFHIVCV